MHFSLQQIVQSAATGTRTQHDVHEFLTDCICSLFTEHLVCPQFVQKIRCITCDELFSTQHEETCPCLKLAIPDSSARDISVQQLVYDYCAGNGVSAVCSSEESMQWQCSK